MAPTISVVITTFNQAPYIAAAVDSVLNQTYSDFEIIVVDDGSTDGTETRMSAYRDRLVYIRQRNQGVPVSRNVGIRHATGHVVAFLDGDDFWQPEKLRQQMEAINAHPGSGLVVTDGVEFAPDRIIRTSLMNPLVAALLEDRDSVTLRCYEDLIRQNLITTTSQVMVPMAVLDRVGLSDERLPVSSDWDLYLRIAAGSDVTFLRQKLVRYRYLATSASGPRNLRHFRWGLDTPRILRKHVRLAPPESRALVKAELARRTRAIAEEAYYHSQETDPAWGRRYLFKVLLANPTSLSTSAYLLGLCAPRGLTRRFGRVVRRVLGWR
jgi:glycosyltransferase involved in cell wall biosynthesis